MFLTESTMHMHNKKDAAVDNDIFVMESTDSAIDSPEQQLNCQKLEVLEVFRCLVGGIGWNPDWPREVQLDQLSLAAHSTLWAVEQYNSGRTLGDKPCDAAM
mmetsp:Transcript_39877/g.62727  ORF Transcript_39877/g.62727 Transcript_39877/m.62727 type:complete len:102 (+) Transcript_39877:38-343(+)